MMIYFQLELSDQILVEFRLKIFLKVNALENVVCKMVTILTMCQESTGTLHYGWAVFLKWNCDIENKA